MLFDKRTDEQEIQLQLAELSVKLADVRKQVGELNAEHSRLTGRYNEEQARSQDYERYAKKAIAAGNSDDAKVFLGEKHKCDQKAERLSIQLREVTDTRAKAMELHDKMVREINDAKTRLAVLTARNASADVSIRFSKTVGSSDLDQKLSGLEEKSELDEAMAEAKRYAGGDDDEQ